MAAALIELHYLPCIDYFASLLQSGHAIIERHENFDKQSYRSRCHINTSQGEISLVIPLIKNHGKTLITHVKIDYTQKWLNNHWRAVQSAYGKAAFFEYYADDIHDKLFEKQSYLYDLNLSLLTLCLSFLKVSIPVTESQQYEKRVSADVIDLRSEFHPKKRDNFEAAENVKTYTQVFGNKFVPNLSIIDLIFCTGPDAASYLKQRVTEMNK